MTIAAIILVSPLAVFTQTAETPQTAGQTPPSQQPAPAPNVANPGGDWVNWNEVEKQYSTDWLEKIQDKTAQAEAAKVVGREQQARSDALADFKKGAGLGISVAFGSEQNSIDDAKLVDQKIVVTRRSKDQPRAALELHQLFTTNILPLMVASRIASKSTHVVRIRGIVPCGVWDRSQLSR